MSTKMIGYTEQGRVYIPDIQLMRLEKGWTSEALRGYGYIVAVLNEAGECIGWKTKDNPIL